LDRVKSMEIKIDLVMGQGQPQFWILNMTKCMFAKFNMPILTWTSDANGAYCAVAFRSFYIYNS
jgi:hypothetical protein